ncbi:hypothetical protein [Salipiger bermudensis]|uniref:hypothetical protein n=1 Tax=Salipiger bermudensis TaxID=344736 RepID=UPI003009CEBB
MLTPSHTNRNGKRLRYYVSNRLISGGTDPSGWRLSAPALEQALARVIADHLSDCARRHDVLVETKALSSSTAATSVQNLAARIAANGIRNASPLVTAVTISDGKLIVSLDRQALSKAIDLPAADLADPLLSIDAPFTCKRRGDEDRDRRSRPRA